MEIQTNNPQEGYPFPCFSLDKGNAIVLNTAYIMCSDTIDVRYILGIHNSSLGAFFSKLYVTQLQRCQFRMLAQYVCKFPIIKTSPDKQSLLIELVEKQLTSPSFEIENSINELIFNLYGLNSNESNYIMNK